MLWPTLSRLTLHLPPTAAETAHMQYMPVVQKHAPPETQALAKRADVLTSERLCMGLSMFRKALSRIKVPFKC